MAMQLNKFLPVLIVALTPSFPAFADQRLSDLVLQVQRLQQEVQHLRGQIEVQQHDIATLKQQQREQYLDLDTRLRARSGATSTQLSGGGSRQAGEREAFEAPTTAQSNPSDMASAPPAVSGTASRASTGEKQAYHDAFDLLKQRRYDDAVRAFEDLLARYPNGEFADNARYWLGETHYVKRDYSAALTQFQRVLATYPLSPKVAGSMLKIGYIHYDQGDWQRARASLQDVIAKFPDSTEARLAESRLDRMTREGH